jgi:hypothetical protein
LPPNKNSERPPSCATPLGDLHEALLVHTVADGAHPRVDTQVLAHVLQHEVPARQSRIH